MRSLHGIFLSVTVSLAPLANAQVIPVDKQKHLAAGAIIGAISASDVKAKHPFWNAVLFSTVAGVGKEFMDLGTGTPEAKDVYFTVAGGVIGGGVTYLIKQRMKKRFWRIKVIKRNIKGKNKK